MEVTRATVVGPGGELREAIEQRFAAGGAELTDDDPSVVVVLAVVPTNVTDDRDALDTGVLRVLSELQRVHGSFAAAGGRIVVVCGDPGRGTTAARAAAAATRSLVGSLAVEWAPSTTFATVVSGTSTIESAADACWFAATAPSGTVVELG